MKLSARERRARPSSCMVGEDRVAGACGYLRVRFQPYYPKMSLPSHARRIGNAPATTRKHPQDRIKLDAARAITTSRSALEWKRYNTLGIILRYRCLPSQFSEPKFAAAAICAHGPILEFVLTFNAAVACRTKRQTSCRSGISVTLPVVVDQIIRRATTAFACCACQVRHGFSGGR